MIRAILFDLDGTLLDRRQSLEQFICEQYNRFASHLKSIEKSEYCSRFLELDNNGYTWKDKVYATLLSEYNITTLTQEQLLHYYFNARATATRLYYKLPTSLYSFQKHA